MFSIPPNFISNLLDYTGQFFNDTKPFIFLAIGVSLGLFFVSFFVKIIMERFIEEDNEEELEDFEI